MSQQLAINSPSTPEPLKEWPLSTLGIGKTSKDAVVWVTPAETDCGCGLAKMMDGTCGRQYLMAMSCYINSTETEKGIECLKQFRKMNKCMRKNPQEYAEFMDILNKDQGVNQ